MNELLDDTDRPVTRGRGRPRIWTDDAERMRAYRARQRAVAAGGPDKRVGELAGRLASALSTLDRVARERDELRALVERQQATIERLRADVSRVVTSTAVRLPLEAAVSRSEPSNRADARPRTEDRTGDVPGGAVSGLSRAQRRRLEREQRTRR